MKTKTNKKVVPKGSSMTNEREDCMAREPHGQHVASQ